MTRQVYELEMQGIGLTLNLISDERSLRLLAHLTVPMRFTQLQRNSGLGSKTLSKKLKELERRAIVTRTLYAQVPLRVEYELTEKGYELLGLLDQMAKWDKKWS